MSEAITPTGGRGPLKHYTLPRGVRFTRTALEFDPDLSLEEWAEVGSYLAAAHRACGIWTGDWVRHGKEHYDAAFVAVQIGQLELPLHGVEKFELLADIRPEARPESFSRVTEEHLLVVAKRVEDGEERQRWLETAERLDLTPRELQASIRAGEVVRIDEDGGKLSFPSPFAVRKAFNRWQRELGDGAERWSLVECQEVLRELMPIGVYIDQLAARIVSLREAEKSRAKGAKDGNPPSENTAGRKGEE